MKKTSLALLIPLMVLLGCDGPTEPEPTTADIRVVAAFTDRLGGVTVTCNPPGGTHPDPASVCAALDTAGGDPERLVPLAVTCPDTHDPLWVAVEGSWGDTEFQLAWEFPNTCEARARSGGLVDLE